jgi:hypothetical protein
VSIYGSSMNAHVEQLPPADVRAEQAVLGAVLHSSVALDDVLEVIALPTFISRLTVSCSPRWS